MPKETIYSTAPSQVSYPDPNHQRVVDVVWGKSIDGQPREFIEIHAYAKFTGRTAEIECIPLTRSDVNRLISQLRKARDQAFGADA